MAATSLEVRWHSWHALPSSWYVELRSPVEGVSTTTQTDSSCLPG